MNIGERRQIIIIICFKKTHILYFVYQVDMYMYAHICKQASECPCLYIYVLNIDVCVCVHLFLI